MNNEKGLIYIPPKNDLKMIPTVFPWLGKIWFTSKPQNLFRDDMQNNLIEDLKEKK